MLSGNLELIDAQLSFKYPGRVLERLVDEGQRVRAGQPIARLDDSEQTQEVALRRAVWRARLPEAGVVLFGDRIHVTATDAAGAGRRLSEALAAEGIPPESVRTLEPSLEDVFVSLIEARDRATGGR